MDKSSQVLLRIHSNVHTADMMEELTAEYTRALNAMFSAARRAPRDERLPDQIL